MDDRRAGDVRWRPAPAWLAAGLGLGAPCGSVTGAAILLLLGGGPDAVFGAVYGGVFGGFVGLLVGGVMTFLGGSHLPGRRAQERAFIVAFSATGLILFVLLGSLFMYIGIAAAFASAVAAGALSHWLAGLGMAS